MIASRKKSIDKPKQCFKRQRHHFAKKYLYCQSYGFSSSRVQLWEFDDKEGWKKKKVKSLSRGWLFATPWTTAYQSPPSMGFSRQEYWSGLPFSSPWAPKNWCFQSVALWKTLESPWGCKENKLVNPKGNKIWIFTGRDWCRSSILWPPDANVASLEKTVMLNKIEGKKRKGRQRMRWLYIITNSMNMSLSKL